MGKLQSTYSALNESIEWILFVYLMLYDTTINEPVSQGNSVNRESMTLNLIFLDAKHLYKSPCQTFVIIGVVSVVKVIFFKYRER